MPNLHFSVGNRVGTGRARGRGVTAMTTSLTISIALGVLGLVLGFAVNAVVQRKRLDTQRRDADDQIRQLTVSAER